MQSNEQETIGMASHPQELRQTKTHNVQIWCILMQVETHGGAEVGEGQAGAHGCGGGPGH